MFIEIDPLSSTPIYEQIYDLIVEAIAGGQLTTGDPLNSTRAMAVQFGINVATVSKAYDQLRTEGFVVTNRKSGTVVARDRSSGPPEPRFIESWMPRLRALLAEATAQGLDPDAIHAHSQHLLASFSPKPDRATAPTPARTPARTPTPAPTTTTTGTHDERHNTP